VVRPARLVVLAAVISSAILFGGTVAASPALAAPACPAHPLNLAGKTISPDEYDHDALRCATLAGANLDGADLIQYDLDQVNLVGASLRGAKLGQADLTGATLTGAHFDEADLTQTTMIGVQARTASFRGAKLIQAHLDNADLSGADLTDADLTQAYLTGATLIGANVSGADFTQAGTAGATMDSNVKKTVTDDPFTTSIRAWVIAIPIGVIVAITVVIFVVGARAMRRAAGRMTEGAYTATAYPPQFMPQVPVQVPAQFTPPVPPAPATTAAAPATPAPAGPAPATDPLGQPWTPPVYADFEPPTIASPTDGTQDAYQVIQEDDRKGWFGR